MLLNVRNSIGGYPFRRKTKYGTLLRPSILVLCGILSVGCATSPTTSVGDSPPENLRLGAIINLFDVRTEYDLTAIAVDSKGRAHTVMALSDIEEVHHIIVDGDQVSGRYRVLQNVSPGSISLTVDINDALHLLVDDQYFVNAGESWQASDRTPWAHREVEVYGPRFVRGAPSIVWSFFAYGQLVGEEQRWDWFGLGGGPAGILFPWRSKLLKRVLVADVTGGGPAWYILDPESKDNTDFVRSVAANGGTVFSVYDSTKYLLAKVTEPRYSYAQIFENVQATPDLNKKAGSTGSVTLRAIIGHANLPTDIRDFGSQTAVAMDPDSRLALVVRAHNDTCYLVQDGVWSETSFPFSDFFEPRLEAAGGDRFHAVITGDQEHGSGFRVIYMNFENGTWSPATVLGRSATNGLLGAIWQAIQIGSNGNRRVFVVWPVKTGIIGRWVEWLPLG